MKAISAIDAIGPAFRRTRSILAEPFRLGFFLKICLVAVFAEGTFGSTFSSNVSNLHGHDKTGQAIAFLPNPATHAAFAMPDAAAIVAVLAIVLLVMLLAIPLWLLVTYLLLRLRFTFFDLVLYKQGLVGRAWSKYGPQTWRYFGLSILIFLSFLLILALCLSPFLPAVIHLIQSIKAGQPKPSPIALLTLFFPMLGVILIFALLAFVVDAIMRDFILPPMAIEDASIESSIGRFTRLVSDEPAGIFVYMLLRMVLAIGVHLALSIIAFIPLGIIGLIGAGIGFLLHHLLWAGTLGAKAAFIAYVVVAGGAFLILLLCSLVAVGGVAGTFRRCYAVIFFADRYPALGNLLNLSESLIPAMTFQPPIGGGTPGPGGGPPAGTPPLTPPPLPEPPAIW